MLQNHHDTQAEFAKALGECREVFRLKLGDYGASWRIMRPSTVTDQIFIKARRVRTLEENGGKALVDEDTRGELMAMVNYGIVALVQLQLGAAPETDISPEQAMNLYDEKAQQARELMVAKNHDYGEAWRQMRTCSYTDLILTKLQRIKQIEGHGGRTSVSEGVASNYMDIINYAVFYLIRSQCQNQQ